MPGPRKPRLQPSKPSVTAPHQPPSVAVTEPAPAAEITSQNTLVRLRDRLSQVAQEFADGKLNRAQFHAIYNRYSEQRRIIEVLVDRNPDSDAWQQVARTGHTSFLRQHFAARVMFFAIYALGKTEPIVHYGSQPPPTHELLPILRALPRILKKHGSLGPARKALKDGHWLTVVPGQLSVSVVLYSLEPSVEQVRQIADLHGDFERANVHALSSGEYTPQRLVFPQRALFET